MNTRKYLEMCWNGNVPVNIVAVAQSLGVSVIAENLEAASSFEFKQGVPTISYNALQPDMVQRFAVAHALSRYLSNSVSKNSKEDYTSDNFNSSSVNPLDKHMNEYAAEFLVPMDILKYVILHENIVDVKDLAIRFGVSQALIGYQIKKLA